MIDYSKHSDQELVGLIKADDPTAYTEIYNRYKYLLYVHIFKRLGDREETKDIIQELFSLLWLKRNELELKSSLSGYLFKSVRNRLINVIAHKKIQTAYVDSLQRSADSNIAQTDYLVRENELMELIEKEIAALPPKMREVFELSRKDNLSHREIAAQLGLSEKTVKKQVNNALKILRVKLGLLVVLFFV